MATTRKTKSAAPRCAKQPEISREEYQRWFREEKARADRLAEELGRAQATIDAQAFMLHLKRHVRPLEDIPF
ncbi:hypothetical protein FG93_05530 [Bosea sp. LC85]|nr:hypothetical protein FG93_05530 [Bosea sp. LC85]